MSDARLTHLIDRTSFNEPVNDSRDPLPGSERAHVLQLLVRDRSRHDDLLWVTGTNPAIRNTHASGEEAPVAARASGRCVSGASPVVAVDVGDSPGTVGVEAHPLQLSLEPPLMSSCRHNNIRCVRAAASQIKTGFTEMGSDLLHQDHFLLRYCNLLHKHP